MNAYDRLNLGGVPEDALSAIDADDRAWSYRDLRSLSEHLSGFIQQCTEPNDRCLVFASSGLFWLSSLLAIVRAGRVAVAVPPLATPQALAEIIHDTQPRLAMADSARSVALTAFCREDLVTVTAGAAVDDRLIAWVEATASLPMERSFVTGGDRRAALVYPTSGDGPMRATILSHANLTQAAVAMAEALSLRKDDRTLILPPMASIFGLVAALAQIRRGGTALFAADSADLDASLVRLAAQHCTGLIVGEESPGPWRTSAAGLSLPDLRLAAYCGSHTPRPGFLKMAADLRLPTLHCFYGHPQTTGPAMQFVGNLAEMAGPVSFAPMPGVTAAVVGDDGAALPPDAEGRLRISGRGVAKGYWRTWEPPGARPWGRGFVTGDLAVAGRDGRFRLTGRESDYVHIAGRRTSAREIEQVLALFPGVTELALIEQGTDESSRLTLAIVHPQGEEIREQLRHFCEHRLPSSRQPAEIRFLSRLPRSADGDVDRDQTALMLLHEHRESAPGLFLHA